MSKPAKLRLDELLVARGLAPSLEIASALVMAGRVHSGTLRVEKAGSLVRADLELSVRAAPRFVSRGGDKLDAALTHFGERFSDLAGVVAVDVGAATGGFTHCLLQRGASKVYAVDVAFGKLHPLLRGDPRVVVMERTNAKDLDAASFAEPIDLIVVDASFVGLRALAPPIARCLRKNGELVALVKPQFEASREIASKHRGVLRGHARDEAIASAKRALEASPFISIAEVDSDVPGPKGNVERLVWMRKVDAEPANAASGSASQPRES